MEYVFTVTVSKGSQGGPAWSQYRSDIASCSVSTFFQDTPLVSINPKVGFHGSTIFHQAKCAATKHPSSTCAAWAAQLAGLVVRCAELRRHHGPLELVSRRRLLVFRPFGFAGAFVCCLQETRRKYNPSSRLVLYGCAAASVDDRCSNSTVAGFNFEWDQVPFIPHTILLPCKPPCTRKEIEKTSGM